MIQHIIEKLQITTSEPIGLLFALILGAVSITVSSCCSLPSLGLIAGYSGTKFYTSKAELAKSIILFMIGTILSVMVIGGVSAFAEQTVQITLGLYWKVVIGVISIIFGLSALKLLPYNFSLGIFDPSKREISKTISTLTGFVLGGTVAVSSLPCNPGIFIIIGAAILQGKILWAISLLGMYAIGFALILGLLMSIISLISYSLTSTEANKALHWASGMILIVGGFYYLFTF